MPDLLDASQPVNRFELITLASPCPVFYAALGPFLGNHDAEEEIGATISHQSGKTWVVALIDGTPVACSGVFLHGRGPAEFGSGYVRPPWRGIGAYRAVLDARATLARAAGATEAKANCRAKHVAVLRRMGWQVTVVAGDYYWMSLRL